MGEFSHVDSEGRARMVDVGHKPDQARTATAAGFIRLAPETVALIRADEMKKGDVLTVAELAGIQAAKKTSELIPLCHPLQLTKVKVESELRTDGVRITATARCVGKTGVEMEALTAASVALLTVYDMCKAVDKQMTIVDVHLVEKTKTDL
jgi:cyclic pyranopterin phosphate synthase